MIKNIINPNSSQSLKFVNYNGRAKSFLDWGQRFIIIKKDNTIIIHRPKMREPVNWQPQNSKINFLKEKNNFVINSLNPKCNEKMKIVFKKIDLIISSNIKDNAKLIISGMEKDIVNQILKNPSIIEEGIYISKKEKKVKSGLIDLYGFDKNHTPVIIEVKRSQATISSVHQLRTYVNDIKRDSKNIKIRGILCAPKIPEMIKTLLSEYDLESKEIKREVILYDDNQKTLNEYC